MSIASEITRLQNDKTSILNALTAKGVTVPVDASFDDIATLIASISGGYEGIEVVTNASGEITGFIWHGKNVPGAVLQQWHNSGTEMIVTFPDYPTKIGANAFFQSRAIPDWSTLTEVTVIESSALRVNYSSDHSSEIVSFPKLTGIGSGIAFFGYTVPKAPSTYKFDTMSTIPREIFTNCSHTNLSVTFGSVGHPVTSCGTYPFHNSTSAAVGTITTFTTGEYLDAVKTDLENLKGSGNLTFIYKASEATTYNGTSYVAGDTILTSTI